MTDYYYFRCVDCGFAVRVKFNSKDRTCLKCGGKMVSEGRIKK